jgi:hypothetical protein
MTRFILLAAFTIVGQHAAVAAPEMEELKRAFSKNENEARNTGDVDRHCARQSQAR